MKTMYLYLILSVLFIIAAGCGDDGIYYSAFPEKSRIDKIRITARLKVMPESGSLQLDYSIKNESKKTYIADGFKAKLLTATGSSGTPEV